jgi:hypothetical protein
MSKDSSMLDSWQLERLRVFSDGAGRSRTKLVIGFSRSLMLRMLAK